jgi:hypothetical protein
MKICVPCTTMAGSRTSYEVTLPVFLSRIVMLPVP